MRRRFSWRGRFAAACILFAGLARPALAQTPSRIALDRGWQLQSSAKAADTGDRIATAAFKPAGWYPTNVPSTVLAALVENKVYPDPMTGMNLRSIPGTTYPMGRNFSALPMPADSPFRVSWWFRKEFQIPASMRGRRLALRFDGINYRANIWLNGRPIAKSDQVAGTYRLFEFDVTDVAEAGRQNVLAVEVFPPEPDDLAWTWVDWNPAPPDKNMGLWRGVSITASGDVAIRHPQVVSSVATSLARADLTVSVELRNLSAKAVHGTLSGKIEKVVFNRALDLGPNERRVVRVTPDEVTALRFDSPRLWWPVDFGPQNLYQLDLSFDIAGASSDRDTLKFGIREITSALNSTGGRQFRVNGWPILIRGGGWAPDMLLRTDPDRQDAEMRYVRDMHLNTIRLEGKLEDDHFFELADQYGILVLAGWCCCDQWEKWAAWKPEARQVALQSQRDQVCRLRSHPSVLAWMNGSDNPPPADVEKAYLDILKELDWPNPSVSSATAKTTTVTGATGVKMEGPYDWVPPSYWLLDATHGGAKGFATEVSPGAAVPPIESLKKMLPADHRWPIDEVWNYHAGGGQFKDLQSFTKALNARYGEASGIEDYAAKSQLMTYEGERAMFEAYARNRPASTGVIQWMLNNAWPGMIWHLYDYYLQPGGGYFGTKKACEPIHIQYSYDDRSVVVINGLPQRLVAVTAVAKVYNLDATQKYSKTITVDVATNGQVSLFSIPELQGLSPVYFVDLRLKDRNGDLLSSNVYWLGTKTDELDFAKSTWYTTPVTSYADLTSLKDLPAATVKHEVLLSRSGDEETARVFLANAGTSLAFFVRLQVTKGQKGDDVLPVVWEDNYITLLPGETREIRATYKIKDLGSERAAVTVTGWNVK